MMKKYICVLLVLALSSVAFAKDKATMLRNNGPLRVANETGGVEWSITVSEGTELDLVSNAIVVKDLVMEKSTIPNCKFYKVKYNNKEYYVNETEVVVGGKAGYIVNDATLFTKPTVSSFRNAVLEFGTFVVVLNNVTNNVAYSEIAFYDTDEKVVKTRYVQQSNITTSQNDIDTLTIVFKAMSEKDVEFKKDQIKIAKDKNASLKVHEFAEKQYNIIWNVSRFDDSDLVSLDVEGEINDSNVNYRSAPGTAGEVLGQFQNGDKGSITLCTDGEETIGDTSAKWYYFTNIENGESGWVFGAFVQISE